ncbi:MAG: cobalt ECF transporter T component CbiQ [Butyrivibrio sp.]|jgi:cobalt/nickel transport system permease protein|nr:cobalt ECF transporter T component CbiQ [Butyrivibrio sp.]
MKQIEDNIRELNKLQNLQQRSHWMNRLHPMGKLLVCVIYIFVVASFDKYAIDKLLVMAIFPAFCFIVGDLSLKEGLYRMRLILPLVLFVGLFNPFFDRRELFSVVVAGTQMPVTGGVISMLTLMLKGLFSVLSAYILIATTSIEEICYALRIIHVPKIIVIVIMLIYRYFGLMGAEADRIATAYMLRAPKQKGIHYSAWGSLVGQWLLRSMDRASSVYESMTLRGFNGDFKVKRKSLKVADIIYPFIWILLFVFIRHFY